MAVIVTFIEVSDKLFLQECSKYGSVKVILRDNKKQECSRNRSHTHTSLLV